MLFAQHGTTELARVGALAQSVIATVIDSAYRSSYGHTLAVAAHARQLQDDLGFDTASGLEQLIIRNVVLNYLRLYSVEAAYIEKCKEGPSIATLTFWCN